MFCLTRCIKRTWNLVNTLYGSVKPWHLTIVTITTCYSGKKQIQHALAATLDYRLAYRRFVCKMASPTLPWLMLVIISVQLDNDHKIVTSPRAQPHNRPRPSVMMMVIKFNGISRVHPGSGTT